MDNFYVITGGPGVGKTTLLTELEKVGFRIVHEDARRIIQNEVKKGGDGLPWKNKAYYTKLMIEESIKTYKLLSESGSSDIHFFDRGIFDAFCYADMIGIDIEDHLKKAVSDIRYNRKVFLLPPWKRIYENDNERKQEWNEAISTYNAMKLTYRKYGYELMEVPIGTIANRADFVISQIG
ncbi:AAA family ATPase [Sphingobacterium corticis]|uniref:AAA family ATPase n=1 Tax=Sphingobacterium corticis TaxID=1812823 RepID=A0ABW5NM02_9SPHI